MARRVVIAVVTGRVQGVGFRHWAQVEAIRRNLEGHVQNRADGSVRAVLAGDAQAVAAMVEAMRAGPAGARVDDVVLAEGTEADLAPRRAGERFSVLMTG